MLTSFRGPANTPEIFRHLVGETVTAAFVDESGRLILLCGSGGGLWMKLQSYGPMNRSEVERAVEWKRQHIRRLQSEIAGLEADISEVVAPKKSVPDGSPTAWDRISDEEGDPDGR